MNNELLGIFITDDNKLVLLEKTVSSIHLKMTATNEEVVTVKELKYVEQEYPNLIQRYEINLIGDNADVSDNETRPRI
jgi:hypothetical protein